MQRGYQKQVTSYFATRCSTISNCEEWNGRYCTTAVQATNRDRVKWVHIRQQAHHEGDRQTTDIHETKKWENAAHKKMDTIEERLGITRNRTPTRVPVPTNTKTCGTTKSSENKPNTITRMGMESNIAQHRKLFPKKIALGNVQPKIWSERTLERFYPKKGESKVTPREANKHNNSTEIFKKHKPSKKRKHKTKPQQKTVHACKWIRVWDAMRSTICKICSFLHTANPKV